MTARSRVGVAFWEVLVVLAIIAFLIAFLFPVFQRVRDNPHHGNCQSNEKQLGLAYVQYSQDADENFPPGLTPTGNGWAGQLYPYIKSVSVYKCPDDPATGQFVSYTANQNLLKQSLPKLSSPAATVALYETTTLNCDPATAETVSSVGLAAPQNSTRHNAQTYVLNFLAADGHVQFLLPAQVSSGPNAQPARTIKVPNTGPVVETFAIK